MPTSRAEDVPEEGRGGQRPCAVVDRDGIDPAGVDVLAERLQRRRLRGVPTGASLDEGHLPLAELGTDGGGDRLLLARRADHHHAAHALDAEGGPDAPGQHGPRTEGRRTLLTAAPTLLPLPAPSTTIAAPGVGGVLAGDGDTGWSVMAGPP